LFSEELCSGRWPELTSCEDSANAGKLAAAYAINVDGAYIPNSGKAALGVIIRDHNGLVQLTLGAF
jgi:hypothetical protein